ncbi:hypothetical protein U9M48_000899 [Paspalum notatum var. saurae]|uniref:DDE Tnp4 domain-containing protein n=1 Tax=Paspalum notatum var. saurae TaxID=547442 RepID=A0AAQ3PMI7_PASNO
MALSGMEHEPCRKFVEHLLNIVSGSCYAATGVEGQRLQHVLHNNNTGSKRQPRFCREEANPIAKHFMHTRLEYEELLDEIFKNLDPVNIGPDELDGHEGGRAGAPTHYLDVDTSNDSDDDNQKQLPSPLPSQPVRTTSMTSKKQKVASSPSNQVVEDPEYDAFMLELLDAGIDPEFDEMESWMATYDMDEMELLFETWWYYKHLWLNRQRRPQRQRMYSGNAWVQHILEDEEDCYNTFHMRKDQFLCLHQLLVSRYGLRSTNNISSEECLAMFLYIVSGPHSNRASAITFGHSKSTVSRKFRHALRTIYNLGVDIIKPIDPTFAQPHPKVTKGAYVPWFENCIGALDGTHIRLQVSGEKNMTFIGRHMVPTFNVLAVVDLDCRFIFVCFGRPGSMHDHSVLQQALVHYPNHFPHPPRDKFYLVDAAYGSMPGFLGPYRNTRYHLQHFKQGHSPDTMEELFNYRHAQLRSTVERAFGQLKNKFWILKAIPNYGLCTSNRIAVACMAVHNFIKDNGGDKGGDWTEISIKAGNNEEGVEPDLPDLMEIASEEADPGYMDHLRDMIAAGKAAFKDL